MRIESATFRLKHTYTHFDTSIAQHGYATAANFGKWVNGSQDYSMESFAHQQLGTWRRFPVMGTWLKGDINGRLFQ